MAAASSASFSSTSTGAPLASSCPAGSIRARPWLAAKQSHTPRRMSRLTSARCHGRRARRAAGEGQRQLLVAAVRLGQLVLERPYPALGRLQVLAALGRGDRGLRPGRGGRRDKRGGCGRLRLRGGQLGREPVALGAEGGEIGGRGPGRVQLLAGRLEVGQRPVACLPGACQLAFQEGRPGVRGLQLSVARAAGDLAGGALLGQLGDRRCGLTGRLPRASSSRSAT